MSLADELRKLEDLRRDGVLSEREFARAKERLLAGGAEAASTAAQGGPVAENLAAQLAEVRYQNELARIDREWQIEKEKYLVTDRWGRRQVPTAGMGYGVAVFGGLFGAFWTVMAFSITGGAPDFGPFAIAKIGFPVIGVVVTIGAIVYGMYCVNKAGAYNRALAAYEARRAAVRPEDFR